MWRRILNRLNSKSKHFDIVTANGHTLGPYTGNGVYRHDLRGQTLFAIEFTDIDDCCVDGKTGMIDLDDDDYATIPETKKKPYPVEEDVGAPTDGKPISRGEEGNNNNDDPDKKEPVYATVVKRKKTEEQTDETTPKHEENSDNEDDKQTTGDVQGTTPATHNDNSASSSSHVDDALNFKPEDANFDIAEMLQEAMKNSEEKQDDADSLGSCVPSNHCSTGGDGLKTFPRAGFVRKMVTFNQTSVEIERPVSIAVACPRVPGWTPDDDEAAAPTTEETTDPDVVLEEKEIVRERRASGLSGDSVTVETDTEDDEVSSLSRATAKKRVTFEDDCVSLATDSDLYSDYGDDGESGLKVSRMKLRRTAALLLAWFWMGLLSELPGATLPYWMHRVNGTYEEISRSYMANGGGVFLGAILAAILIGWCIVSIDIGMATSLLLATCSVVVTPWCSGLVLLAVTGFVAGLSRGLLTVVGIVYVYRLWDSRRTSVALHLLYASFSLGGVLAPYLVLPFIDDVCAAAIMTYLQRVGLHDVITVETNGHGARGDHDDGGDDTTPLRAYSVQNVPVIEVDSHPIMVLLYGAIGFMVSLIALWFFALHVTEHVQTRRRLSRHRKIKEERRNRHDSGTGSDTTKKRTWRIPSYSGVGTPEQSRKDSLFSFSSTDLDVGTTDTSDDEDRDNGLRLLALITKKGRKQNGVVATAPAVGNGDVKTGEVASLTGTNTSSGTSSSRAVEGAWFVRGQTADVPMLMYLYVFFALSTSVEYVFATFVTTFAADNEHPSASHVVALFWASSAASRLAYIGVSRCLPPNFIVIGNLTVSTISSAVLALYGGRYTVVLYMFTALIGAAVGPITPGGFTWANAYLMRSAKSTALACCVAAAGLTLSPWLVAFLVDYFGTSVVLHACTTCGVASMLLYMPVMNRLGSRKVFKKKIRRRNDFVYSNSQKDYV